MLVHRGDKFEKKNTTQHITQFE